MSLAQNIRFLRKKQGWGQDRLAEKLGYKSYTTIQKWESGVSEPPLKVVHELAKIFSVDINDLTNCDMESASTLNVNPTLIHAQPYNPTRKIPILGRISAGLPLYAEEHIEGFTYTELNGGAEYFALRVSGDSMNAARIYDGDTLIVRQQDIVENGQIAVVIVGDDEATVKRFYKDGKQITLMPQSTNHIHQPQIYDSSQTHIRVVGLVVKNEITF